MSAASLSFANRAIGASSALQQITLTNGGTAALSITSIVASGDFAQNTTCGASLAAGAACAISVVFTPTAAGTRTGSVTITDSAPGSPHIISLGGSGSDFSPTSLTVVGGQTGSFTVGVVPSFGFNTQVHLSCQGSLEA